MAGSLFKQPLIWFALIGLALFVIDGQFTVNRNEVFVSSALRDRLGTLWLTQTGQAASATELDALVENWIQEEVLYQEALRLGLDQDDSIVRRRLVQKLSFIAESEESPAPEYEDLLAYYQANLQDYTLPVRYSFQQLFFSQAIQAEQALTALANGANPRDLGESSMLNPGYAYRSALDLNATFGAGFADQLTELETGLWQGPVQSGFGLHLVLLNAVHAEQISPFDTIQRQVTEDYHRYQQLNARNAYIDNLLQEYTITVETR